MSEGEILTCRVVHLRSPHFLWPTSVQNPSFSGGQVAVSSFGPLAVALRTLLLSGITEKDVRTGSFMGTAAGELGNIDSAFSLALTFSSISLLLVPASLRGGVRYATQTEMQYRLNACLLGVSYIPVCSTGLFTVWLGEGLWRRQK